MLLLWGIWSRVPADPKMHGCSSPGILLAYSLCTSSCILWIRLLIPNTMLMRIVVGLFAETTGTHNTSSVGEQCSSNKCWRKTENLSAGYTYTSLHLHGFWVMPERVWRSVSRIYLYIITFAWILGCAAERQDLSAGYTFTSLNLHGFLVMHSTW